MKIAQVNYQKNPSQSHFGQIYRFAKFTEGGQIPVGLYKSILTKNTTSWEKTLGAPGLIINGGDILLTGGERALMEPFAIKRSNAKEVYAKINPDSYKGPRQISDIEFQKLIQTAFKKFYEASVEFQRAKTKLLANSGDVIVLKTTDDLRQIPGLSKEINLDSFNI